LLNTGSVFKLEHRLHGFFLECTVQYCEEQGSKVGA
jgi:hypothetical protein